MRKKIYLACPYSHGDPTVRRRRFEKANTVAARLMKAGHLVFSPISHTHPIAEAGDLPKGWQFWADYDRTFIAWADEIYVLRLPGHITSAGVTAEIDIAGTLGKPVVFIDE